MEDLPDRQKPDQYLNKPQERRENLPSFVQKQDAYRADGYVTDPRQENKKRQDHPRKERSIDKGGPRHECFCVEAIPKPLLESLWTPFLLGMIWRLTVPKRVLG